MRDGLVGGVMQFHLNGFRPGDPAIADADAALQPSTPSRTLPGEVDVLIVGMFQAFGFADKVAKEAYWVNETVFWRPDPDDPSSIRRSDRIQDVEDGLSEMPHVILNQARVHDFSEKAFCPGLEHDADVFELRAIDRSLGALVIVRTDQHLAHVLPFDAFDEITAFFDQIMFSASS